MKKDKELYSLEIVFPEDYMDPMRYTAFGIIQNPKDGCELVLDLILIWVGMV